MGTARPVRSSNRSIRIAATAAFPAPASSIRTTTALACARPVRSATHRRPARFRGPSNRAAGADGRPVQLAALPPEEQPEVGPAQLPAHLRRQEVTFPTKEPAGTIVVDTSNTHLYYVLGGGRAIRYGVRVGRDGFTWTGVQKISRKAEWPDWHPPTEMIERQPYLPRFMAGGPGNPLGARAMYLGSTIYRIHGTNQPSTIGKFVSSGCIGMLNEDVSDLFERAKVGTRVVVLPGGAPPANTASASAAPPSGRLAAAGPGTGFTGPTGARSRRAADGRAAAARPGHDSLRFSVSRTRCSVSSHAALAEPGPIRLIPRSHQGPGSAAHHCVLRRVRGMRSALRPAAASARP